MSKAWRKAARGKGGPGKGVAFDPGQTVREGGVEVRLHGNDRGTAARRRKDADAEIVETVEDGRRVRAVRTSDTISRLLSRGSITPGMSRAARRFQRDFTAAALDPLRAGSFVRQSRGKGDDTAVLAARDRVAGVVGMLGGHGTPAASAVWFVAGGCHSIKDWAQRERVGGGRALNEHTARGILIGALSALTAYYGYNA